MKKFDNLQKRKVDELIENNELCNLIIYLSSLNTERNINTLKCQEFSIQSMTGGKKCCRGIQKIPECKKAKLSDKPEICKANFSVHAQEPPESQTHSNIPPVCDWRFLTESFSAGKNYFWKHLSKRQKLAVNNIMGTACMLYLDLDTAIEYFIQGNNTEALHNVRELGMLYGKYDAVKSISEYGVLQNHESLVVGRAEFEQFLITKVLPHIRLERDNDEFFVNEKVLGEVLNDISSDNSVNKGVLDAVVERMYKEGSRDMPRKLLLSLYGSNQKYTKKAKLEFSAKLGKRKGVDSVVENICRKNSLALIRQMQAGDKDDFYPLSANLYLVEKQAGAKAESNENKSRKFVLKENLRYRIDFSCLYGYNMESELYAKLDKEHNDFFPGYHGVLESDGIEFIMLDFVEGKQITEHTKKDNLIEPKKTIDIAMQLSSILEYLHSKGIIYADMKDKNVMLDGEKVRLLDFGMASTRLYKEACSQEEFVHEVVSNAEYACPETVMMSRVYKKSDVFQLGIMLYKLLTGRHPFAYGKATEDYTERESELIAFSLANLWNPASFDDPIFVHNPNLKKLVSSMLDKDYTKRPDASRVCVELEKLKEGLYLPAYAS